jgi:hypothetical protein
MLHRRIFQAFIESEFSTYKSIESLIISLTSFKLMLASINQESAETIFFIDGSIGKGLSKLPLNLEGYKQVVILRSVNGSIPHYFTIYIENSNNVRTCVLMDASNCNEHFPSILEKLNFLFDEIIAVVGNNKLRKIQNDTKSCMLFALDHALTLSSSENPIQDFLAIKTKINNIHQLDQYNISGEIEEDQVSAIKKSGVISLDHSSKLSVIQWIDLPFKYVKHMQTVSGIGFYIEHHRGKCSAEEMVQHEITSVRKVNVFDPSGRSINCSLHDFSASLMHGIVKFIKEKDFKYLLSHVLGASVKMEQIFEVISGVFSDISHKQNVQIYNFLFKGEGIPGRDIDSIVNKIKSINDSDLVVDLIRKDKLSFINILTHPRMQLILCNRNLLSLLDKDLISESALSYIRSESQLKQLESEDLMLAILTEGLTFDAFVREKAFDLMKFREKKYCVESTENDEDSSVLGLANFL